MANYVLGRNVRAQMEVDSVFYDIFCGKTAEFPLEQDEIEVTHVNSGAAREFVPGMSNAMLSVSGVTVSDNSEQKISAVYLMQVAIRRGINTYRLLFTDQNGDQSSVTFDGFVRTVSIAKDVTAWSQSSVAFRVSGEPAFSDVIPPPVEPACEVEPTIYATMAEGEDSVTNALLIPGVGETIEIISVSREGVIFYETTGTPGNMEFFYDDATGTISFDPTNPALPDGEQISIEYKKLS